MKTKPAVVAICILGAIGSAVFLRVPGIDQSTSSASNPSLVGVPDVGVTAELSKGTEIASGSKGSISQLRAIQPVRLAKDFDWKNIPAGLGSYVTEVLVSKNGDKAYDVAQALQECSLVDRHMRANQDAIYSQTNSAVRDVLIAKGNSFTIVKSQCQSVQGDISNLRAQLLQIAVDKNVVGSAAELYFTHPGSVDELLAGKILSDAKNGDLQAIFLVTSSTPNHFGADKKTLASIQSAIRISASIPELKSIVPAVISLTETVSMDSISPGGVVSKTGAGDKLAEEIGVAIKKRYVPA